MISPMGEIVVMKLGSSPAQWIKGPLIASSSVGDSRPGVMATWNTECSDLSHEPARTGRFV